MNIKTIHIATNSAWAWALAMLLYCHAVVAAPAKPSEISMSEALSELLQDDLLQTSQVGLMVWDLTADSALFAHQQRQLMRPASIMKVLTAVTALDYLGGSYQLNTSLYYKGDIRDSVLRGDLYAVGGMDPCFSQGDMYALAARLRQMGVDTIRGNIVADCSMKDTLRWGEGWCWDDKNPTLTPLLIDRKDRFVASLIETLASEGVVLDSVSIAQGRMPVDAVPVGTCQHSIDQVLLQMMKESDNLFAECLYYQVAASMERPARALHARSLMRQFINRLGLDATRYKLADGSGLSLYNYVSPELMVATLRYAWFSSQVREHLLPSLPIAGQDGTLKSRMRKTAASDNVQAKTGTLTGISSLAGYCTAANGHHLCFCIINQGVMRAQRARDFQDRLCTILCTALLP